MHEDRPAAYYSLDDETHDDGSWRSVISSTQATAASSFSNEYTSVLRARLFGTPSDQNGGASVADPCPDVVPHFISNASFAPTETTPLLPKTASLEEMGRPPPSPLSPGQSLISFAGEDFNTETFKHSPTPLPMYQLAVLLVGQLPEPVVATVLYPFINQLVAECGITGGDEKKVGYYAGFIESLFFLAEFCMVLRWGRLSDRIGRKPVILCGLMGLTLSSACFGLSTTYAGLVISRALAGALSGNIGVMKSAIGEITDESNIAEGFALLPVVWSAGATLGPLIGGFLSRPHEKYPKLFQGSFWRTYPYFLPCATAALICLVSAAFVAVLFEESLPALRRQRFYEDKEYQPLPSDAKRISHQRTNSEETLVDLPPPQPLLRDILTPPVTIAVSNYAALALLDIAFSALLPLFYATPIESGGLGLSTSKIGLILGLLGLVNGIFQGLYSAKAQRRLGVKNVYIMGVICFFGIFLLFPVMNALARKDGHSWTVMLLALFHLTLTIGSNSSFGCIFLFITSAAEKNALGSTNGIAQTVVSFMRMIGPASATSLFALTMEEGLMGGCFVYWVLISLTCVALVVSLPLPRHVLKDI